MLRRIALLLVFALVLVGCAGGDEADETTSAEEDTEAAESGTDAATDEESDVEEESEAESDDESETEDTGAAAGDLGLAEEGSMLVGSDIAFAPFEFIEADGEPQGFDIDLMTEIAGRLGVEVEFVNTSFDTIFTQLASGDFDAIISGITITEEREQTIAFSEPYFAANQALAVGPDSEVTGVDGLAGTQLAVQAGTTGLDYATENFTDATIVEFPTSEAAFGALTSGQVDAVFIDLPVVAEQVENSDGAVEQAAEVETGELYGIGVQQDNTALTEAISSELAAVIADGTYEEIYGTWFAGEVPEQFAGE